MNFLTIDETEISNEWYFERLRLWRNAQLQATDWTQVADAACDKAAWAKYRQALRDLPNQSTNQNNLEFPNVPA
jgi:hypothetical protein